MNERKESLVATNGSDTVYPAKGHIVKIKFNNGKELDINKNDIVIFVGPNNAGKSQSLSDIYQLAKNKVPTIVVSDIEVSKEGSLKQLLEATSKKDYNGNYIQYTALNHMVSYGDGHTENYFSKNQYYGEYRNWFVTKLDTQARLSLCFPAQYIRRDEPKTNPIHYAAFDKQYRKWLSGRFKQAFGTNIIPNTQFGAEIPLCLGDPVKLEDTFSDEQERQEAYADILETYKQVQDQGDGIKSFTGILLSLMLNYYCTYLIDEPESFLHPPQARIMGQIIGETLSDNQQAFISTHSEDVIKGLLEACTDRLKIVRITRYDDTNDFSILDNQKVKEIFGDPLLKYSNIMSSLFHNVVVLCESDSDCKLYSVIDSILYSGGEQIYQEYQTNDFNGDYIPDYYQCTVMNLGTDNTLKITKFPPRLTIDASFRNHFFVRYVRNYNITKKPKIKELYSKTFGNVLKYDSDKYDSGKTYQPGAISGIIKLPSATFKALQMTFYTNGSDQEFTIKALEFSKIKVKQV